MRSLVATAVLAIGANSAVCAQAAKPKDQWASQPTSEELRQAVPPAVRESGGRVVMKCKASADGLLSECAVLAETSPGTGQALLSLATKYRLAPDALNALPPDRAIIVVEGWYRADTLPDWRRKPTAADLRVVWPAAAWARGIGGGAHISCLVSIEGAVYDCVVIEEHPAGQHFGHAAIALTPQFLMRPATRGGRPVIMDIEVPVEFKGASPMAGIQMGPVLPPANSWTEAPTFAEVMAAYPPQARTARQTGFVSLHCGFTHQGQVTGCDVVREEPSGQGFARAALKISTRFRLDPKALQDVHIGDAVVTLPIAFDIEALKAAKGGKPNWTRMPDLEDLRAAFVNLKPSSPSGRAVLNCTVQQGGGLGGCSIAAEDPNGSGLGQTALALQTSFRLATWTDEGLPVVGEIVQVPVRFDFRDAPAAVSAPAKSNGSPPTPGP